MLGLIKGFLVDDSGATAIEYGLIAALISVSILVTLVGLSEQLVAMYNFTWDEDEPSPYDEPWVVRGGLGFRF